MIRELTCFGQGEGPQVHPVLGQHPGQPVQGPRLILHKNGDLLDAHGLPSLNLALVDDAHRLALTADNGLGRHQSDLCRQTQHGTQAFCRRSISPRLSVNISGVISTWTSRVSVDFTRSTMI